MFKIKPMTYLIIGIVLTSFGAIFTFIGSLKQSSAQQDVLTKNLSSTEESKNLAIQIEVKANEHHNETTALNDTIKRLTEKLLKKTEEYNLEITKPQINVLTINEKGKDLDGNFNIIVRNNGGSECEHLLLHIDSHPAPLVKSEIKGYELAPKNTNLEFSIPMFRTELLAQVAVPDLMKKSEEFYNEFKNYRTTLMITYHFEYEWKGKKFRSDEFLILKFFNDRPIVSILERNSGPIKQKNQKLRLN